MLYNTITSYYSTLDCKLTFCNQILFQHCFVVIMQRVFMRIICILFLFSGIDGGFDNNEPEYIESYEIVILPHFATLSFPSVELPEKVLTCEFY